MSAVVVWTPNNARIWWACPTCKVEAGITPTVPAEELLSRLQRFIDQHANCQRPATAPEWRKES